MSETEQNHEAGKPRHEKTDANIRNVVWFAVGLTILVVGAMIASRLLFNFYAAHQGLGPPASPFENERALPSAGVPRLQVKPASEFGSYAGDQQEMLKSYGWVDQKAGIVHIPIDRAMDLLLERGLPVRKGPPVEAVPPGRLPPYTVPKGYTPMH